MSTRPFLSGTVGMVHVAALPGTARAALAPAAIVEQAAREARILAECGFDAIIVENMHDRPYLKHGIGPEVTAAMAAACAAVRGAFDGPIGIQILGGGSMEALAVAHATGLDFVRAENFVFSHVADEGLMADAAAGPLLRARRAWGADRVRIYADIKMDSQITKIIPLHKFLWQFINMSLLNRKYSRQ
jgi:membrane complex biogenesis BtpA family protein